MYQRVGLILKSALPPGWEVLYTPENVPYYVNHNTKTTQWQHPNESSREPIQKPAAPVVYDRCEMCTFDNAAGSAACEMCGFKLKSNNSANNNSVSANNGASSASAEVKPPVAPAVLFTCGGCQSVLVPPSGVTDFACARCHAHLRIDAAMLAAAPVSDPERASANDLGASPPPNKRELGFGPGVAASVPAPNPMSNHFGAASASLPACLPTPVPAPVPAPVSASVPAPVPAPVPVALPAAAVSASMPAAAAVPVPTPTVFLLDWTCHTCTMINKSTALVCDACGTSPAPKSSEWICAVCTLANRPTAKVCSACYAPRNVDEQPPPQQQQPVAQPQEPLEQQPLPQQALAQQPAQPVQQFAQQPAQQQPLAVTQQQEHEQRIRLQQTLQQLQQEQQQQPQPFMQPPQPQPSPQPQGHQPRPPSFPKRHVESSTLSSNSQPTPPQVNPQVNSATLPLKPNFVFPPNARPPTTARSKPPLPAGARPEDESGKVEVAEPERKEVENKSPAEVKETPQVKETPPRVKKTSSGTKVYTMALEKVVCKHVVAGEKKESWFLPRSILGLADYLSRGFLQEEGLFRVSGQVEDVHKLMALIDEHESKASTKSCFAKASSEDIYQDIAASATELGLCSFNAATIAGAFKAFWQKLPEPLLTYALYKDFLKASGSQEEVVKVYLRDKKGLPPANLAVANSLLDFLAEVALHSEKNRMTSNNLAVVFAPSILRASAKETPTDYATAGLQIKQAIAAVNHLIIYRQELRAKPPPSS